MAAAWLGLKQLPYYEQLMAVGSDDRACYTAGVSVTQVRFISYVITGLFAGVAGLMLTALIGSLMSVRALRCWPFRLWRWAASVSAADVAAFLLQSVGAMDIFLLQSGLTYFNVSTFVLQIAYGLILVVSVSLNALPTAFGRR